MIFLLFFSEKQVFTFHANNLIADSLQEFSKPVSGKNKKKKSSCRLLKNLPSMLTFKQFSFARLFMIYYEDHVLL